MYILCNCLQWAEIFMGGGKGSKISLELANTILLHWIMVGIFLILIFLVVEKKSALFFLCVVVSFFCFSFGINITVTIIELYPLSSKKQKFIKKSLTLIFMHPCMMGDKWLILFLVCLVVFSK